MNNIELSGRLTADPIMRSTNTGKNVTNFTLAVDRAYSPKEASGQTTDFIPCVAWEKTGEDIAASVHKGNRLLISRGILNINKVKTKDGRTNYYTQVRVVSFEYIERKGEAASTMLGTPEDAEFAAAMASVGFEA